MNRRMIAKNNIFNIRAGGAKWIGMTGTRKGFVEFDNREHAIRAWLVLMRTYRRRYGCKTIRTIVARFAPPNENNTEGYIAYCCRVTGLAADEELATSHAYGHLAVAMAKMETATVVSPVCVCDIMKYYNIQIT